METCPFNKPVSRGFTYKHTKDILKASKRRPIFTAENMLTDEQIDKPRRAPIYNSY